MADALAEGLALDILDLVGEEDVAVDFERGRERRMERERKRLIVRVFFVGDAGMGGTGIWE